MLHNTVCNVYQKNLLSLFIRKFYVDIRCIQYTYIFMVVLIHRAVGDGQEGFYIGLMVGKRQACICMYG